MDKTDAAILNELRKDARIPNRTLAEKVHLSPSAALGRVNRLKREGFIRSFETRLDHRKLGCALAVFVELSIEKNVGDTRIGELLTRIPEVLEIYAVAGEGDYLLKIVTTDSEALRKLMYRIGAIPGVRSSRTTLLLGTLKQELSPLAVADRE